MLSVLALAGFERLINTALKASPLTDSEFAPLIGKTLRLVVGEADFGQGADFEQGAVFGQDRQFEQTNTTAKSTPQQDEGGLLLRADIAFDVLFCGELSCGKLLDPHVRFEPIKRQIFEPQGGQAFSPPDCTLHLQSFGELINLIKNPPDDLMALDLVGDTAVFIDARFLCRHLLPSLLTDIQTTTAPLVAGLSAYLPNEHSIIWRMFDELKSWQKSSNRNDSSGGNGSGSNSGGNGGSGNRYDRATFSEPELYSQINLEQDKKNECR